MRLNDEQQEFLIWGGLWIFVLTGGLLSISLTAIAMAWLTGDKI